MKINPRAGLLRQHISETKALTLSYRESALTFEFAALSFISSRKNQYAYRLEGFDDEWRYCGTKREATHTNLDPGHYMFQVKAANSDGVWSPRSTALALTITPPWWKTAWFRALVAAAVLSGGVALYRLRTNNFRAKLRQERLTKAAELREARLHYEKGLMELSKTQLEAAVLHKNSELASSVMSIVRQNESLLAIKDQLKEANEDPDAAEKRKKILRIVRQIEREITPDQHWHQFEELFNQLHENFMQRLKETYPQLTSRDLKLCAYLSMNLSSKEAGLANGHIGARH
ncbi:MAG: triple tyrosine motif-containing protein [Hymenobacter sp.]